MGVVQNVDHPNGVDQLFRAGWGGIMFKIDAGLLQYFSIFTSTLGLGYTVTIQRALLCG